MLEAAQQATGLTPGKARALLGNFLFSGEDAEKPLDDLSGGERRRLSLAILVQSGANVLVLDEPTNHLDLESREALEAALKAFPGSVLLVSHDRALLDAIGTRTIALEDQTLHSYVGGWPEYLRVREERAKTPAPAPAAEAEADAQGAGAGEAEGCGRGGAGARAPDRGGGGRAALDRGRAVGSGRLGDTPGQRPLDAQARAGKAGGRRAVRALGGDRRVMSRATSTLFGTMPRSQRRRRSASH